MRLNSEGVAGWRRVEPLERERDAFDGLRAGERLEVDLVAGFRFAPDRFGVRRVAVTMRTNVPAPPDSEREAEPRRQSDMTTGTIMGRRLVRSLTNLPAVLRTTRCKVSGSWSPFSSARSTASATRDRSSSSRSSASSA